MGIQDSCAYTWQTQCGIWNLVNISHSCCQHEWRRFRASLPVVRTMWFTQPAEHPAQSTFRWLFLWIMWWIRVFMQSKNIKVHETFSRRYLCNVKLFNFSYFEDLQKCDVWCFGTRTELWGELVSFLPLVWKESVAGAAVEESGGLRQGRYSKASALWSRDNKRRWPNWNAGGVTRRRKRI